MRRWGLAIIHPEVFHDVDDGLAPRALEEWVQVRIVSGRYASASDYVADAISRDRIVAVDEDRWLADLDA